MVSMSHCCWSVGSQYMVKLMDVLWKLSFLVCIVTESPKGSRNPMSWDIRPSEIVLEGILLQVQTLNESGTHFCFLRQQRSYT